MINDVGKMKNKERRKFWLFYLCPLDEFQSNIDPLLAVLALYGLY